MWSPTRLEDRSDWLRLLTEDGEALSMALANADEVKRPDPGSARRAREEEALPLAPADHVKRPLASTSATIHAGIRAAIRAPSASSPNPAISTSRVVSRAKLAMLAA